METIEINGETRALFGCKASPPDPRDRIFQASISPARLAKKFDPRIDIPRALPRVEDQTTIGSCVGNGSTSATEYLQRQGALLANQDPDAVPELSRLFTYYAGRAWVEKGDPHDDSGMYVRSGLKAVAQFGSCREDLWPYDVKRFGDEPSAEAKADALSRTILSYHRVLTLDDMMSALMEGTPVVGGFMVPASIGEAATAKTGIIKMPDKRPNLGGHCVWFAGYDQSKKMLLAQNSWGAGYGDKGYIHLPFAYWDEGLLTDCWQIGQARKVPV